MLEDVWRFVHNVESAVSSDQERDGRIAGQGAGGVERELRGGAAAKQGAAMCSTEMKQGKVMSEAPATVRKVLQYLAQFLPQVARMERCGFDYRLEGAGRLDGGSLRAQMEQTFMAPSPVRHGRDRSKQSLFVCHGTMGVVFGVWRAHQGTEAQLALPMRRHLEALAIAGRAGPKLQVE